MYQHVHFITDNSDICTQVSTTHQI